MKVLNFVVATLILVVGMSVAFTFMQEGSRVGNISISGIGNSLPFVVTGYVYVDGTPAGGASVAVINVRTGEVIHNSTSSDGIYSISLNDLPSGWQDGDKIIVFARSGKYYYGMDYFIANSAETPKIVNLSLSYLDLWHSGMANRSYFDSNVDYKEIDFSKMPHRSDRYNMPKNRWIVIADTIEFWFSEPIAGGTYWSIMVTLDDNHAYFWYSTSPNVPPGSISGSCPKVVVDIAIAALPMKNAGQPVADAGGPYTGTAGEPITFDASNSYDPDGYIVNYTWNFGDYMANYTGESNIGYGKIVQHTYSKAKPEGHYYLVKLTVTDNDGNVAVSWARAYVNPPANDKPPVAIFSYYPKEIYPGTLVTFDASASYDPDGDIKTYSWDFGDGKAYSSPYPTITHSYTKGGFYHVSLVVYDKYDVSNKTMKMIEVKGYPMYHIDVTIIGQGTVVMEPNQTEYMPYQKVNLTAIPDDGWVFKYWQYPGTASSIIGNPITITMDGNKSIIAVFGEINPQKYILTVESNPQEGGHVTAEPADSQYDPGTTVTLTAHANEGYKFTGWSGDASGQSQTITITMNSDKTIVANFEKITEKPFKYPNMLAIIIMIASVAASGYVMVRKPF